ncbi:MAG TPA: hypothetical protein PK771_10540, partial [Spirochaetota bacterium]|nr:hypothetical protein [Spirochaetota bacterium]
IIRRLTTPRGSVFFDTNFGSELHKMIKSKNKNLRKIELHIKKVLIECDEIAPDTIEVKATRYGEDLILKCSFRILGNKLIEKLFISMANQEIEAGFYANNTN